MNVSAITNLMTITIRILIVFSILLGCTQRDSSVIVGDDGDDTTHYLQEIAIVLEINKKWQRTDVGSENVIGFKKACEDSVFCPSLTLVPTRNDGILNSNDEAIAEAFLAQLRSAGYESVQRSKVYHVSNENLTNPSVLCCEFTFEVRGMKLISTSCLVRSEKTVLATFSSNMQHEAHEKEVNKFIKNMRNE